ncbi:MAG: hypothetical protein ACR2PZ_18170 [Pseudomonadales bacterium]
MSVMEFILVAHAIIVGLAVAEILRGLAEMVRAENSIISSRLLLIAGWTLLLLWQVWWAIWQVGDRAEWTFPEFLMSLIPVALLYVTARLCFPEKISGSDHQAYYSRISPQLFLLVGTTYLAFAFFWQPFVFGEIVPWVFASQVAVATLAIIASRYHAPAFQLLVIVAMVVQVIWRGLSSVVGT